MPVSSFFAIVKLFSPVMTNLFPFVGIGNFSRVKKKAMIINILNNVRWSCHETRATNL